MPYSFSGVRIEVVLSLGQGLIIFRFAMLRALNQNLAFGMDIFVSASSSLTGEIPEDRASCLFRTDALANCAHIRQHDPSLLHLNEFLESSYHMGASVRSRSAVKDRLEPAAV